MNKNQIEAKSVFLKKLIEQTLNSQVRIVFPEGEEERILKAADALLFDSICTPTLIGHKENIIKKIKELALDSLGEEHIFDIDSYSQKEDFVSDFVSYRKEKAEIKNNDKYKISKEEANELFSENVNYIGAMLLKKNFADGMVSGSIHSTGDVIRSGLDIVGTKEGMKTVSSYFLMLKGDEEPLFFADCGVIPHPTEDQLVDLTRSTIESALKYEVTPKVALLSFSTYGSGGNDESVLKMQNVTKRVKENYSSVLVDGELQFDAAHEPAVAASKCPNSPLKGHANVFIFPDLNAGNIGYKLVQRLGGYVAIGPILQGFAKPILDQSRGCSAEDIYVSGVIIAKKIGKKE